MYDTIRNTFMEDLDNLLVEDFKESLVYSIIRRGQALFYIRRCEDLESF